MILRHLGKLILADLEQFPVVAILGPRQSGKTTLGRWAAREHSKGEIIYLDLELPSDRLKLENAEFYFKNLYNRLIIIDEIQRKPELFPLLRSIVDDRKRNGEKSGQFLILGSSSPQLLRYSSDSLAGRVIYHELTTLNLTEVEDERKLWLQGGFPDSFLNDENQSFRWRENFIITLIEKDIPEWLGVYPSDRLFRLWRLLSQDQGGIVNFAKLGAVLGISGVSVRTYIEKFIGLYFFRFLQPWTGNPAKRLIRSPKLYFRDSGLLHNLLGISSYSDLINSKYCGDSWEGFVIEQILAYIPKSTFASFYRSSSGNEIDLVLEWKTKGIMAIEIKLSVEPNISRGFHLACDDIGATQKFVIIPGKANYNLSQGITVLGLTDFLQIL